MRRYVPVPSTENKTGRTKRTRHFCINSIYTASKVNKTLYQVLWKEDNSDKPMKKVVLALVNMHDGWTNNDAKARSLTGAQARRKLPKEESTDRTMKEESTDWMSEVVLWPHHTSTAMQGNTKKLHDGKITLMICSSQGIQIGPKSS